ncbi:MAG TPA: hypothetical protein VKS60_04940 [Stellaceae bacterium]|nr:hypothetical protein [Stellaceae bacterium]
MPKRLRLRCSACFSHDGFEFERAGSLTTGRSFMLDAALIALGFAFLAIAILYTYACDRL